MPLKKDDKELLARVNEVLFYIWDPIGVVAFGPSARDEYDSYALQVFGLLKKRSASEEIANFLNKITVDRMGLSSNIKHDTETAILLLNWMDFLETRGHKIN